VFSPFCPPPCRVYIVTVNALGAALHGAAERDDEIELPGSARVQHTLHERAGADYTRARARACNSHACPFLPAFCMALPRYSYVRNLVRACVCVCVSCPRCGISRRTLINNLIDGRACFGPAERIQDAGSLIKTDRRARACTHACRVVVVFGPRK